MPVSEPLPHFVDDLLGYLHETHPTHATLDGIHVHDDGPLEAGVLPEGIECCQLVAAGHADLHLGER